MTKISAVLIAPVVTEKTVGTENKFVFRVHRDSTKPEIATAVKEFYGVDAQKINIVRLPEKTRFVGRGRLATKRSQFKKAIVTLKSGSKLDFNAFK